MELLPCPFCSGVASIIQRNNELYDVGCDNLECIGWICKDIECPDRKDGYVLKASAIDRWNTRIDLPQQNANEGVKDEVEQLANIIMAYKSRMNATVGGYTSHEIAEVVIKAGYSTRANQNVVSK